tara:strand:+ start:198 stop:947 length:750 start_codon:yes stop_codon:yes gene_type:complete
MCTVSFYQTKDAQLVLTSNRDEQSIRPTTPPSKNTIAGNSTYYPTDEEAGGTWIAVNEKGQISCLLNGAFENHIPKDSYSKSRGKVVLEAFEQQDILAFFKNCKLEDVQPFTLITVKQSLTSVRLYEFRWDSTQKHLKELDPTKPYIWSSATLYSKKNSDAKENWFMNMVSGKSNLNSEDLYKFHNKSHGADPENDLLINRDNKLKTVSITQVKLDAQNYFMTYHDLIKHAKSEVSGKIKKKACVPDMD